MTTTTAVIGLVLALYNANTTTDWVRVAHAAQSGVPIRAILPVHGVVPPDPNWAVIHISFNVSTISSNVGLSFGSVCQQCCINFKKSSGALIKSDPFTSGRSPRSTAFNI